MMAWTQRWAERLKQLIGIEHDYSDVSGGVMHYRDYQIMRNPYQVAGSMWLFSHHEYGGPGDNRIGTADSIEACKRRIDQLEQQ